MLFPVMCGKNRADDFFGWSRPASEMPLCFSSDIDDSFFRKTGAEAFVCNAGGNLAEEGVMCSPGEDLEDTEDVG